MEKRARQEWVSVHVYRGAPPSSVLKGSPCPSSLNARSLQMRRLCSARASAWLHQTRNVVHGRASHTLRVSGAGGAPELICYLLRSSDSLASLCSTHTSVTDCDYTLCKP